MKRQWMAVKTGLFTVMVLLLAGMALLPTAMQAQEAEVTLTVVNESSQSICYVHISPTTSMEWGDDWLGATEVILPGASRAFQLATGEYDVMFSDCNGNTLLDQRGLSMTADYELRFMGSDTRGEIPVSSEDPATQCDTSRQVTLTIINESAQPICYVHISPTTSMEWGDDWLGATEMIMPGATRAFQLPACEYDVMLSACNGNTLLDERGLNITADYELRFTDEDSREIPVTSEDPAADECDALYQEGLSSYQEANYDAANQALQAALTCYQQSGNREGEADALHVLGVVAEEQEQYAAAEAYYQQSLTIKRQIGDREGEAYTLFGLGNVAFGQEQYAVADTYYQQSLALFQEAYDQPNQAKTLYNRGVVAFKQGQQDMVSKVRAQLEAQETRRRQSGQEARPPMALYHRNHFYRYTRYAAAKTYYQRSMTIYQETGNHQWRAHALYSMGLVAQEQGQYAEAATYYQQSLVLYREIGDRVGEADSLFRLGYVAHEQEQYAEAEGYYLQCLPIYQELGDSHDEAATLNNLGVVAADQERYAEAEHLYQQSLAIYQEIGEHHDAANTLNNLGNATRAQERYAEAEEYYLQSLALYREVGDLQSQAKVLNNLGDVVEAQGRYAEAEEYYRQSREVSQGGAGDAQGVGTDSAAASSPASTDQRCFAETGYCIAGAIRTYWEQQGGLAVFGYPITAQREETIEGATLSVQWFERDRLEDHGAAGVMAGRLGAAMLAQRGTPWESYPQVETAAEGCHYFAETGHSLCEPFLSHWQQQGGLQRFGYPLTEPQQETIGDWTGTVQYFERRRMEHHAENPQPYDMLLGLLGSEVQER